MSGRKKTCLHSEEISGKWFNEVKSEWQSRVGWGERCMCSSVTAWILGFHHTYGPRVNAFWGRSASPPSLSWRVLTNPQKKLTAFVQAPLDQSDVSYAGRFFQILHSDALSIDAFRSCHPHTHTRKHVDAGWLDLPCHFLFWSNLAWSYGVLCTAALSDP